MRWVVLNGTPTICKTCTECHEEKPLTEFYPRNKNPDGTPKYWASCCKPCDMKRVLRSQRKHPEKARARQREVRKRAYADPEWVERQRAYRRAYHAKNKDNPTYKARRAAAHAKWWASTSPGYRAQRNEFARIEYQLKQDREHPDRIRRRRKWVDGQRMFVKADAFGMWLTHQKAYHQCSGLELGALLGIEGRRVNGVLNGATHVAVDIVDRALVNAEMQVVVDGRTIVTFEDLYPGEKMLTLRQIQMANQEAEAA